MGSFFLRRLIQNITKNIKNNKQQPPINTGNHHVFNMSSLLLLSVLPPSTFDVGFIVGCIVGDTVVGNVGFKVGLTLGFKLGYNTGLSVGFKVGGCDGAIVGAKTFGFCSHFFLEGFENILRICAMGKQMTQQIKKNKKKQNKTGY